MPLIVVGLNHKSASIDIREKMSVAENDIENVVTNICKTEDINGCVVISTCNRTEFYMSCAHAEIAIVGFCDFFGVDLNQIKSHIYIKDKMGCIEHLFLVSSGLDSMVLGEAQILGQVKSSYEVSKSSNNLDKILDRLFQSAFRVAKSVRNNTDIGKNPVSIANSAVQLSKQIFGELSAQKILMIGAGSTAELLIRYLIKYSYQHLSICNRSINNAQNLAQQFNCDFFDIKQLSYQIENFDLIFTATASQSPLINYDQMKKALANRKHRPIVIIDLGVPRDVDANVKKLNDVFYYAVDDLQKVISKNLKNRIQSSEQAKKIIDVESEAFHYWQKAQQHNQLIHNFQKETAKIRKHSLDLALSKLNNGADAEEVLFFLANNLTKKLNHTPVKAIRSAIQSGNSTTIETIKTLLKLESNWDKNNDT
ncbi:MAG: glutamyl-tRNA reductase [Marinicellaceae bacterium]